MNGLIRAPRMAFAHNLLDNSDFRNPVNQRGMSAYTTQWGMSVDRWYLGSIINGDSDSTATMTLTESGIQLTATGAGVPYIQTRITQIDASKTYTLAWMDANGVFGLEYVVPDFITSQISQYGFLPLTIQAIDGTKLVWAALYEGIYTADTLPPYVPKGYAAELAECLRYYQHIVRVAYCYAVSNNTGYYVIEDFPEMRIAPTIRTSVLHNGGSTADNAPVANGVYKNIIDYITSSVLLEPYKSAVYDCYLSAEL